MQQKLWKIVLAPKKSEKGLFSAIHSSNHGFSLVELLVTISIMVSLTVISMPLTVQMFKSGKVTDASAQLSGIVEEARNQALAQQSYVWVALSYDSAKRGLWAVALDSGKVPSTTASDLRLLSKPVFLQGVKLGQADLGAVSNVPSILNGTSDDLFSKALSGTYTGFEMSLGAAGSVHFDHVILFSPRGEASIASDTVSRSVVVGIVPEENSENNGAVVEINGLTSSCSVYRP